MPADYLRILLLALVGAGFFSALLLTAALVRDRTRRCDPTPYECGMEPVGSPWVSPNIRFYTFALAFVIFDVEALFIFPWAVRVRELGVEGFAALLLFVGILFVGWVYAWKKGALSWE